MEVTHNCMCFGALPVDCSELMDHLPFKTLSYCFLAYYKRDATKWLDFVQRLQFIFEFGLAICVTNGLIEIYIYALQFLENSLV